jgi:hypothetical protein
LPSPDRLIGPWFWVGFLSQALPNQQVVDYPSFKLVIVGDGGTGDFLCPSFMPRMFFFLIRMWMLGDASAAFVAVVP